MLACFHTKLYFFACVLFLDMVDRLSAHTDELECAPMRTAVRCLRVITGSVLLIIFLG